MRYYIVHESIFQMEDQWFPILILIVLFAIFIVWGRRDAPETFEAVDINADLEQWTEPTLVSNFSIAVSGIPAEHWRNWDVSNSNKTQVLFISGYGRVNSAALTDKVKNTIESLEEVHPVMGMRIALIDGDGRYVHVTSTLDSHHMHVLIWLNGTKEGSLEIMVSKDSMHKLIKGHLTILDAAKSYIIMNKSNSRKAALAIITVARPDNISVIEEDLKPPRSALVKFLEKYSDRK